MKVGGVVEALVELMMKGSEDAKAPAAAAVRNLAINTENTVWVPPAWPSAIWDAQAHPRNQSEGASEKGVDRPETRDVLAKLLRSSLHDGSAKLQNQSGLSLGPPPSSDSLQVNTCEETTLRTAPNWEVQPFSRLTASFLASA